MAHVAVCATSPSWHRGIYPIEHVRRTPSQPPKSSRGQNDSRTIWPNGSPLVYCGWRSTVKGLALAHVTVLLYSRSALKTLTRSSFSLYPARPVSDSLFLCISRCFTLSQTIYLPLHAFYLSIALSLSLSLSRYSYLSLSIFLARSFFFLSIYLHPVDHYLNLAFSL